MVTGWIRYFWESLLWWTCAEECLSNEWLLNVRPWEWALNIWQFYFRQRLARLIFKSSAQIGQYSTNLMRSLCVSSVFTGMWMTRIAPVRIGSKTKQVVVILMYFKRKCFDLHYAAKYLVMVSLSGVWNEFCANLCWLAHVGQYSANCWQMCLIQVGQYKYKVNAQSLRLFGLHRDVNDAYRAGAKSSPKQTNFATLMDICRLKKAELEPTLEPTQFSLNRAHLRLKWQQQKYVCHCKTTRLWWTSSWCMQYLLTFK